MKIAIIVAMEEEFDALHSIFKQKEEIKDIYKTYKYHYNSLEIIAVISKIGKAASASATTAAIIKYNPDLIINMGSSGGLNKAQVGDIIIANQAGYSDVDTTAFGYKLGQLPQQPEFFQSSSKLINFNTLVKDLEKSCNIKQGFIITNDSFIADKEKVNSIKDIYPNSLAVEMEAAAIAQVCHLYEKDFLFIKKISDMADKEASSSFKEEINKMQENTSKVLQEIFKSLDAIS